MKFIELTKGARCLVDDEDYVNLNKWSWHLTKNGYAARRKTISRCNNCISLMHREIINTPTNLHTDHINGDKLDNRRINLRPCTKAENSMAFNTKAKGCSSKFIGVSWDKEKRKWHSYIKSSGKRKNIGYFNDEYEAAKARDVEAIKRNGDFFNLNIIKEVDRRA